MKRTSPPRLGLLLSTVLQLLSLTSNSFIVAEERVVFFLFVAGLAVDARYASASLAPPSAFKEFWGYVACGGTVLFFCFSGVLGVSSQFIANDDAVAWLRLLLSTGSATMRTTVHEPNKLSFVWFVNVSAMVYYLVALSAHVPSLTLVLMRLQIACAIAYWSLPGPVSDWNWLARACFALNALLLVLRRARPSMTLPKTSLPISLPSFDPARPSTTLSVCLVLGPASPAILTGFLFVYEHVLPKVYGLGTLEMGASAASLAVLGFFATGHECVFGALRITAPYVGFEEFSYYRGLVMLTLDTFNTQFLVVLLLVASAKAARTGAAGGRPESEARGVEGFVLVFALRCLVTTLFVFFQRRHLMVWAIFAPKFIYDAAAFGSLVVFREALAWIL